MAFFSVRRVREGFKLWSNYVRDFIVNTVSEEDLWLACVKYRLLLSKCCLKLKKYENVDLGMHMCMSVLSVAYV